MHSTLRRRLAVPASLLRPCWRFAPVIPKALFVASVASLVAASAPALRAQSPSDEVITLDALTTTAEADDVHGFLPTRQTDSAFGTSRALIDTPRSVTLIESSVIDLYNIRTVNDFVSITAGTFTGNYFGVPGAIDVRGERADNFFRGFRRVENRGNFPTPISGADYVEIIKGPASPVYGGGKIGGVLNFIPKSAKSKTAQFIEKPTGQMSGTLGTYGKRSGSIEYGTPFEIMGKKSGAYLYIQGEDSDSYYRNVYNKGVLTQLSVDTQLSDTVLLQYGGMYQYADLNQSLGWNRVTQGLIDSEGARYQAGQAGVIPDTNGDGFLSPGELNAYFGGGLGLEQFTIGAVNVPLPDPLSNPARAAAFGLVDPSIKSLSHRTVQAEKADFSTSDVYTGFFDIVKTLSPDSTLKNQSFYDAMDHTKYSSYGFTADYTAYVFENKTTFNWKTQPHDSTALDSTIGFSTRYSEGEERESRSRGFQVLDRRDLTVGPTPNDRFLGAYVNTADKPPYNYQQLGRFTDTGLFALFDATVLEHLGLIAGGRYDYYDATTNGTAITPAVLPPFTKRSRHDDAFTYNASINYKAPFNLTPYLTYAKSTFLELGQGGMIYQDNLNPAIAGDTWLQDSTLKEIGVKASLLNNRLFLTLAYYQQDKSSFDTDAGNFTKYESEGTELEIRYAPTKTLSFTGTGTWQRTEVENPPFNLGIPPEFYGLDGVDYYGGRLLGYPFGIPASQTGLKSPTPPRTFSLQGTYTNPAGWGASFGGTYVASFNSGYLGLIRLPEYVVCRGALFYTYKDWSFRLNVNNVFDEKYYTPQFLFWDTFISPSQGTTADLTVTYKF